MHAAELPILARTVRGIEWIARDEVCSRLGVDRVELGHRELRFAAPLGSALLGLGTVDDVFIVVGEVDGITRHRDSLGTLASLPVDLDAVARMLGRGGPRTFDVVASFLGRRNYNRFELESSLAVTGGWTRIPRNGELSLRIHVVGSVATVAARVARAPLHRRAYRVETVPGSLHPPLARALVLLAGMPFVDPFCGAGTIPLEGALAGLAASGSDVDPHAVAAARRNATAARVAVPFAVADAAAIDEAACVVTNPPWGKAVPVSEGVLPQARRLVVLTSEPPRLRHVVHQQRVRVHGALATVTVTET